MWRLGEELTRIGNVDVIGCVRMNEDEDVWLLDGVRRDVNKEMEWWTLLGAREEMTLSELRRLNCVDDDNVHLTGKTNRSAAEILCHRLMKTGGTGARMEESGWSRGRRHRGKT